MTNTTDGEVLEVCEIEAGPGETPSRAVLKYRGVADHAVSHGSLQSTIDTFVIDIAYYAGKEGVSQEAGGTKGPG